MKKIKFILCLAIVAVMAFPFFCLAGCGDDGIEIVIKYPKSLAMNSLANPEIDSVDDFLKTVSEEYAEQCEKKIKIRVVAFESGYEKDSITHAFDTDNAADILYDDFFNMASFIHTGKVVPLDDVLTNSQKEDLREQYLNGGKLNGKQYMLPFLARQNILIYNKKLLKECDLDVADSDEWQIENWSIEQWTDTLDTLAEKLTDGKAAMMMYAKDNQGDTHIMTLMRAFGSNLFGENDRFDFTNDPSVKDALKWIQSGVKKGWYMPVSYDKSINDCSSKFKVGELAFYHFNLGSSLLKKYVLASDGKQTYGFVNYPGNKCTFFCDGFEVFDNGNDEKIAAAKDFIRYIYGTDKWLECSAGCIPVSGKVEEKYEDQIFMLKEFADNAQNSVNFNRNLPNWQGSSSSVRSVFYKEIAKLLKTKANGDFYVDLEDPEKTYLKEFEDKLNNAINEGFANSHPHE